MKAFIYTRYGPPEVLKIVDLPIPTPGPQDILVRVKAASVNRTDCANLRAKPDIMRLTMGLFRPQKQILGTEFAGIIEETGAEVDGFRSGDRVFGFSDGGVSSYAEYLLIRQDKGISLIPEGLAFVDAAGCIEGFHYAYNFINKVQLKHGDEVLINGADGGIGSATVQLAKYYGGRVTAVCRGQNTELLLSLGANDIIDYTKDDFTAQSSQYDYVFDSVGKSTLLKCAKILKPGGTYISSELGPKCQNLTYSLATAIFGKVPFNKDRKVLFPYPPDIPRSIRLLKELIENDQYKPTIDRTYRFTQIPDAFKYVEQGKKTGNVVITI